MEGYERQNRIREALRIRNMKQVELCEKTKIKKSSLNNWLRQRWQPKQEAVMKMARVLDVSEMWLAGYDVPMERPVAQIKNDELKQLIYEIKEDDDLKDLFSSICSLNNDQRQTIKSMVSELSKLNSLH
jgi:transcriptional regulator with XRE-family HTH domain